MMQLLSHRTKIVATIGPASSSPDVIRQMVKAGMSVARLNFSHGTYDDHAHMVTLLRSVSKELDTPITLLQDLQGPKIRVGELPKGSLTLNEGDAISLVPADKSVNQPNTISIDYPYLAQEAEPGYAGAFRRWAIGVEYRKNSARYGIVSSDSGGHPQKS